MTNSTTNHSAGAGSEQGTLGRLERTLDEWRARIDELKIQLELGAKDANDSLTEKFQVVQNGYLAARSSLRHAQESGSDLAAVRQDLTRIVRDLKAAYDAMNEVVRRSHGE
jgi:hypothetical protein